MSPRDEHETVHVMRRPALPDRPADAPPPPPNRRRTAAIVGAAVVASALAGYVVVAAVGGGEPGTRSPAAATATSTVPALKRTPAGSVAPAAPQAPATPPVAPTDPAPPAAAPLPADPAAPPPAGASAIEFDAPIPAGWRERDFAVQKEGYLQSRWDDPRDARTYLIIDWTDRDRDPVAIAARTLRQRVSAARGYREVRFAATRDAKGWIWVYTVPDERGRRSAYIDVLSRRCGVLFAVLGVTTPKRFASLQRTFIRVSEGIRLERRC